MMYEYMAIYEPSFPHAELNKLGALRWELIAVLPAENKKSSIVTYILIREYKYLTAAGDTKYVDGIGEIK